MKRQTRPFAAELKNPGKQPLPSKASASGSHDEWIDPFPDDVPERDVHEDLVVDAPAEIPREAGQALAAPDEPPPAGDAPAPVDAGTETPLSHAPAGAAAEAPHVLADPLAGSDAGQEPGAPPVRQRRSKRSAPKEKPQPEAPPPSVDLQVPLDSSSRQQVDAAASPTASESSPARSTVTERPSRRGRKPRELPAGQRWKQRRLPRVCWDR